MVEKTIENNDDGICDNVMISVKGEENNEERARDHNSIISIMFLLRFMFFKKVPLSISTLGARGLGPPVY